eukprot:CAMPEP_0181230280 /NCGR_PEP_ID=MMETSP1096-20121128/34384_1 /TAXON_ID=156174 ORGANISM="Chrysochromulina ericina, Strain CCMP281" /NCGR_SAMPLE_ID=MMETSP1096 /ASSEMBLY_ACC=CAM_ASM_000453 /LENGTH=101 /DNA_ID=CAMNT_0023324035 /DNA_START=78 /DNA_END=379 /DNA_ORIENTATION=-
MTISAGKRFRSAYIAKEATWSATHAASQMRRGENLNSPFTRPTLALDLMRACEHIDDPIVAVCALRLSMRTWGKGEGLAANGSSVARQTHGTTELRHMYTG